MEKYCKDITFCLQQCGKEARAISTYAGNLSTRIAGCENEWDQHNGNLMMSTVVFVVLR